ncbi:MAG: carboxypeptidase-like regulatory domain-containing protein [Gemmatimonadaceae bacterium]|nr:carboxypeptidase-like regulatory domain-containing protein [Gemmatimonadaceae bacterium]
MLALPLSAQTVRGRVVDRASGQPIAGAIVSLMADTARRWPVLSDSTGAFRMRADSAGTYTVRVDRVGYAPFLQGLPLTLAAGSVIDRTIVVPSLRAELATVRVTTNAACAAPGIRGADAALVWEQVRTALASQALTARQALVTLEMTLDEALNRGADPQAFLVKTYRRPTQVWRSTSTQPFVSPRGHDFAARGFRIADGDSADYFGPDAEVALSPGFLETHCFRVVRERRLLRRSGRLGLAFAPLDTSRATFLTGTMWLEAQTSRLSAIEYAYVVPGWPRNVRPPRGAIRFAMLPSGAWIVRDWEMWLPVLSTARQAEARHLATFEKRGRARPVADEASAAPVVVQSIAAPVPPVVVLGVATDPMSGGPVRDAAIRIDDIVAGRTDSAGRSWPDGRGAHAARAAGRHAAGDVRRIASGQRTHAPVSAGRGADRRAAVDRAAAGRRTRRRAACPGRYRGADGAAVVALDARQHADGVVGGGPGG